MIICIVGPTAVGKTKLSEEIAKKYNAIVVNCDSMQVYKELNIGTAKITEDEKLIDEHLLFDIKNPDENYTVYDYQKDVRKILNKYKDKNIVFVGGTGLYLKAALYNYEFSERETKSYDEYTNQELYDMLEKQGKNEDVHINNRKRMISKLNSTGNNGLKDELLYDNVVFIGLTTSREKLYEKINNRVDDMFQNGLLEGVKDVYKKYGTSKAINTGIGYKEVVDYINDKSTLDECKELIKSRSRHYAKRQYTWFKNQMNINWFETDYDNFNNTISSVCDYINSVK